MTIFLKIAKEFIIKGLSKVNYNSTRSDDGTFNWGLKFFSGGRWGRNTALSEEKRGLGAELSQRIEKFIDTQDDARNCVELRNIILEYKERGAKAARLKNYSEGEFGPALDALRAVIEGFYETLKEKEKLVVPMQCIENTLGHYGPSFPELVEIIKKAPLDEQGFIVPEEWMKKYNIKNEAEIDNKLPREEQGLIISDIFFLKLLNVDEDDPYHSYLYHVALYFCEKYIEKSKHTWIKKIFEHPTISDTAQLTLQKEALFMFNSVNCKIALSKLNKELPSHPTDRRQTVLDFILKVEEGNKKLCKEHGIKMIPIPFLLYGIAIPTSLNPSAGLTEKNMSHAMQRIKKVSHEKNHSGYDFKPGSEEEEEEAALSPANT